MYINNTKLISDQVFGDWNDTNFIKLSSSMFKSKLVSHSGWLLLIGPDSPPIKMELHGIKQESIKKKSSYRTLLLPFISLKACSCFSYSSYLQQINNPLRSHFRVYNIRVEDIMVRDVQYITLSCSYRDLLNILMKSRLKALPLLKSAGKSLLHTVMFI